MPEKYNFAEMEPEMLKYWDENDTYKAIQDKAKANKAKKFYFLDGPPYTSGKVHLGTAWNKSLKDMVLRYKRMKGFDVWDRAGYDMHGLPTEHATMKKLDMQNSDQIQSYGVDKFIAECKQLCIDNMNLMNDDFKRLGVWMDFENAYQSIKDEFIDGEWWLIKKAHEQKRLYRGLRTMTWCPISESALAKHELEYQTVVDKSIFVKFKVREESKSELAKKEKKDEYLIIWTTTPWTIPFNLAVMVNPDLEYVRAEVDSEIWILSKALGPMVVQAVAEKKYNELEEFYGAKLEGVRYEHFFEPDMHYSKLEVKQPEKMHSVLLSNEYVDTSAGSGLVHCAPGCGPEDYEVGYRNGLPAFNTLDTKGIFPKENGQFAGMVAKTDDVKFIEAIDKLGHLVATNDVEHEYPHDWRHHKPVIFRTTKQWFFKVEDIKDEMIKENNGIRWVPDTAYNAFNSWLQNLRDNSISKQRYWGTPIPIWVNVEDEDDYIVVGSIKELEELSAQKVEDPHIPKIDNITIKREGKTYRRVPDILDVWVDAGTASWNCLYYPHRKDLMDDLFPAEFILEGKDQIRGWFNLLHVASMISMKRPSFKNVYMHGFVQDSQGRKMSKSLGNYILPQEVIDKFGADTFRYYFIGGANPGIDINYNPEDVELKHKNLNVLWNVHNFVVDYFTTNNISLSEVCKDRGHETISKMATEERYMMSTLHSRLQKATESFEAYRLNEVPLIVEELFLELSRGYIQLIRDKAVQGTEEEKEDIAYVLSESLITILKMIAPITPFIAEKMYQDVKHVFGIDYDSVHMMPWPEYNSKLIDEKMEKDMHNVNAVIQGILFAREKSQLGVRWPVKEVTVETRDKDTIDSISSMRDILLNQTNIKDIKTTEKYENVKLSFKPDYGKLARFCGENTQRVAQLLIDNHEQVIIDIHKNSKYIAKIDDKSYDIIDDHLTYSRETPDDIQAAEFRDGMIYLDKTRTPQLESEGFSREIIRRVQSARKDAGMKRSDRIELYLQVPEDLVDDLAEFEKQIVTITGSKGLMIDSNAPEDAKKYTNESKFKIKGKEIVVMFSII
ncbi:isoleucine--tRNA ligase [Candidatus Woesearchaeota archaeon]|nr:isoleucine--tRNA ligase [Candidatus Woesearchaeota archaeon]